LHRASLNIEGRRVVNFSKDFEVTRQDDVTAARYPVRRTGV